MSMSPKKNGNQTQKKPLDWFCYIIVLGIIIMAFILSIDFEGFISNGLNVLVGLIGLHILVNLKNKALTIGWTLYLTGLVVDLLDEFLNLPKWIDDYYEDTAYGIGLVLIVLAFYMIVKEKQDSADHFKGVSNRDNLTGLYNHRYFYEYFQQTAARTNNLILLFCDLDYFKTINDTYGHVIGDSVLKETAEILKSIVNDKGICCRYGGEEYAILLEGCEIEEAVKIAGELNRLVAASRNLQQYALYFPITISIGIASYSQYENSAHELLEKADRAMYYSKQKGGNQFTIFNPDSAHIFKQNGDQNVKKKMLLNAVISLVSAVDAKDKYTSRHSELVTKYALQMAEALNISEEDKFRLRIGALLHDCGKIGIPDEIINKPGELTDEEFKSIKNHSLLGFNIIKYITDDSAIIACVLSHHEQWDGNGYPNGLAGKDIPLFARLISIADAFHAMTSNRPYRSALSLDSALKDLKKNAGTQFDPDLVKLFVELQSKSGNNLTQNNILAS